MKQTHQQRQHELHRLLTARRPVVASKLASIWHCDERTIRRQLQQMRDRDHLPIEYDRVKRNWRYTSEVAQIDPLLISVEDRRARLFSLKSAAQFDGTPIQNQIRRLYDSLLKTLSPERKTDLERMMQSVRFIGPEQPAIKQQIFETMLLCLEARETMSITYTDGNQGRTIQREIDPYGLMMRDRRWTLVAYCHRCKAVLVFSLHRMSHASSTDRSFKPPTRFMDSYLANAFEGIQSNGKSLKVILRIRKDSPPFVQQRQWSTHESRKRNSQGDIIITFKTPAIFAVERAVLAEGGNVELLKPIESRRRLCKSAQTITRGHHIPL